MQAFFSAFSQKLDLPKKVKNSIFPKNSISEVQKFDFSANFVHIQGHFSPKTAIQTGNKTKKAHFQQLKSVLKAKNHLEKQKLDLKSQKLDLESQKLDLKSQKLDFPAFYSSGLQCIRAEKKAWAIWVLLHQAFLLCADKITQGPE